MLKEYLKLSTNFNNKTKKNVIKATFFSLLSIILDTISIVLIIPILTSIISPEYIETLIEKFNIQIFADYKNLSLVFSLIFLITFILAQSFKIWCSNYILKITKIYKVDLIDQFINSILSNNEYREEKKTEAYYLNLITKEIDLHTQYAFSQIINISRDVIILVIAFIIGVINFGFILFLVVPLFIPLFFVIKKLNNYRINKLREQRKSIENLKFSSIKEFFFLFVDIYIKRKGKTFIEAISNNSKSLLDIERKQSLLRQSLKPVAEVYIVMVLLLLFVLLIKYDTSSQEVQLSYMVYIMILITKILPSINKINLGLYQLSFIANTTNSIYSTIKNYNNLVSEENYNLKDKIIFKDVEIKNGENFTLSIDDFQIKLGDTIRIKGKSGSGKSSIFNLILGLNKPSKGQIFALGYNVHYLNNDLLKYVGYVAQETRLFNGSLAENISFGVAKELIDSKKVVNILEKVGLGYLVKREKAGIWQEITSENYQLSGGEKQKIGIARALYNDPKLLLFDEITTSLDLMSKDEIFSLIEGISSNKKKIVFYISHEDNIPISFDYEIEIENGKARFGAYSG